MWIALSVRLTKYFFTIKGIYRKTIFNFSKDDRIPKQVSVAQAFFKYGGPALIKRLSNVSESIYKRLEEDVEDEQDIEIIDDDEMESSGIAPPSRWDRSSYYDPKTSTLNISSKPLSQNIITPASFTKFFRETLAGSIISLWPESTTLTLPMFLAEKGFYDALKVGIF